MKHHKVFKRRYTRGRRQSRPLPRLQIRPAADPLLKKDFARIGTPEEIAFKADVFQLRAVEAILQSDCLVSAPTGSGKTWIALQAIGKKLNRGQRVWYASPLKALTNAKYLEFGLAFGPQHVGILTGDRKENSEAPIITGTTEILRNQLYDAMHRGDSVKTDLVVLDEAHYLGDPDRGVVWEEVMIYLPKRIPLLMLSATIGNADQIASWLGGLRKKRCIVVHETRRPVPLTPLFFHPRGTLMPLLAGAKRGSSRRLYKKVAAFLKKPRVSYLAPPNRLPPLPEMINVLRKYRLLPAIFFLKSRSDCDQALQLFKTPSSPKRPQRELLSTVESILKDNPHLASHRQLHHLQDLRLGAHHSGQLPAWKLLVESLMARGLLDAVFATSTVAAGVNFPARTIVLLNSDRFNGSDFIPLGATQFHQMTGRAGRRGMDRIGFALALPGKYMRIKHLVSLINSPPDDVHSQIRINFSMVLNLLLSHTPEQIVSLLKRSFAQYLRLHNASLGRGQSRQTGTSAFFLADEFKRHLKFLERHHFTTMDAKLTQDGIWAARLRLDQPLLVAEGLRRGFIGTKDPAMLAGLMAAFVYEDDPRQKEEQRHFKPEKMAALFMALEKGLAPFANDLSRSGFEVRRFVFKPVAILHAWVSQRPWEEVLRLAKMSEGSLAMLLLRTADTLRHVAALADVFPEAARSAQTARNAILRTPVIMETGDAGLSSPERKLDGPAPPA